MSKIKAITAREILDSRGKPTLEVSISLSRGAQAKAAVPAGASTGALEAAEKRDGDFLRYNGLGVLQAVKIVNHKIAKALKGTEVSAQKMIDQKLLALDGTKNKSQLGANAILGASLAVARAAACEKRVELFEYLRETYGFRKTKKIPIPMFNILNGGKHSDSGLSFQEFMIVPYGINSFAEQLRAGSETYQSLKEVLHKNGFSVAVGDEGGFAPRLASHNQALDYILEAIKNAGRAAGKDIFIALDAAANSFYEEESGRYLLKPEGVSLARDGLINLYREFIGRYFVFSVEDGLAETDWEGWAVMTKKASKVSQFETILVGDDLLVTNVERLKQAVKLKACTGVIVKPNQIGTLSETASFIKLAQRNKMKIIVSHRSGETNDDFIADLAVAAGADFIKAGAPCRGERLSKYNRLLAIEELMENKK